MVSSCSVVIVTIHCITEIEMKRSLILLHNSACSTYISIMYIHVRIMHDSAAKTVPLYLQLVTKNIVENV